MQQIIFPLLFVAYCNAEPIPAPAPAPEPQDFQAAALMLAGQLKDILDNGAAARDDTKFEFMGMKVSNNMAIGFGEAMKVPGGRYRREIDAFGVGNSRSFEWDYSSSSDYSSYESEELGPSKVVGKEEKRDKRAATDSSSAESWSSSSSSFSSLSSSSSSSSSWSGESEDR